MPFRINAKAFILTYPRAGDIGLRALRDHFVTKYTDILGLRAARELHEDGEPHYHVVFHMPKPISSRNERVFDYDGHHPNIQATRDLPAAYKYLIKDGDYLDYGDIPLDDKAEWIDVINANSKEEALALAKRKSPRDYVLHYDRILSFCEQHFTNKQIPYSPEEREFNRLPDQLSRWCAQRLEVTFSQFFELQQCGLAHANPNFSSVITPRAGG